MVRKRVRSKGRIEELPSGALRVSVYAGDDPVTKRRHYLRETVPDGPKAQRDAERTLRRLINQVDERRNPRTTATINQLLDRHLELLDLEETTLRTYRGYAEHHIRPLVGRLKVGAFDADVLDSYYAELRRCRAHCDRRPRTDHRTDRTHDCDARCHRHECKPLGAATVRQIHFILSGAFKRAVRWRWVAVNPMQQAQPPAQTRPDPRPPSAADAARILTEAWKDPDWGAFVWLAMTTGARRGELCALRWHDVDLDQGVLQVRSSIAQNSSRTWEKSTKTHQQRRIALDPETVNVLRERRQRCETRAEALETTIAADAFVFSLSPDSQTHLVPDSVSQRYSKMARRLSLKTHLHSLRHYSATELIAAGVDVRTVAGRLGHGGGGTTTLRVYTAWVSESDQRAARTLFDRLPQRPAALGPAEQSEPQHPFEKIAACLRDEILDGTMTDTLPSLPNLAAMHHVGVGTAHRAVNLLKQWGLIQVSRGTQAVIVLDRATSSAE